MATPGINAGTDGRLTIRDAFLEANRNNPAVVIDCITMTPRDAFDNVVTFDGADHIVAGGKGNNAHFEPRGISIDGDRSNEGGVDLTADSGLVNGCLRNERNGCEVVQRLMCGVTHPNRYRAIYPHHTTARGIKIHM